MDTMRTALAGEACLAPTKPCGGKAIDVILLPLQGAHELRLFIPKHHLSVIAGEACLAIRRGFYYGVPWRAATTAMQSENMQRAFYGRGVPRPNNDMDTMRTALAGEACLAPTKPCGGNAINTILLPLQGAHELRLFIPKYCCPVKTGYRIFRAHNP